MKLAHTSPLKFEIMKSNLMTSSKKHFVHALALVLAAVCTTAVTSCSDDDDDDPVPSSALIDFVTVASNTDSGSSFTVIDPATEKSATLVTTSRIGEEFQVGTRALIQYTAAQGQYESGQISLYGINSVINGTISEGNATTTDNWSSDPANIASCYRTGKYLNLSCMVNMSSQPNKFEIVADEATLADEYPTAHILFKSDNTMAQQTVLYASIDLSPVWNLQSAKGIKFIFHTSSGVIEQKLENTTKQDFKPAE